MGNDAFADWVPIGDMASEIEAMTHYGMEAHAALIAATMFGNEMFGGELVIWMALLSVYPVVTAIMAWDPVYAIGHNLVENRRHGIISPQRTQRARRGTSIANVR